MGVVLPLRFLFVVVFVEVLTGFHGVGCSSQPPMTPIPFDLYHSSAALLKEIKATVVRHPDTLTMETIKAGNKGYAAEVLVVTYNRQTEDVDDQSKLRVLLSFGQHGRELITSEVALQLLSVLAKERNMQRADLMSLHKLLDNLVIKMVPMENLNGRKLVEAADLCERRNGRGVDLNRNWGVDWGKKEKDYDPYEENPGTAPFSEPEAQIMRQLAKSFEPHIWANVHSGMEALFTPYDHKNKTPEGSMSNLMDFILREVNHLHFEDKCLVGSGGGLVGYLAHGTTTDYMYDVVKVPLAFTFEIYGDSEASSKDCFKMFNPVDKLVFNKTVDNWTVAFLTLFKLGFLQLRDNHFAPSADLRKWVPFGGRVTYGSHVGEIKDKMDGLELGMQDMRTYFRLFMLSSVLLLFMFCSRITKSKYRQIN
ncbi:putative metallocarboxypeptidase ECM14 [Zingiber officinale]|uniref:putative metallocarboxypeptidase ECM14 n=1 Tax=Zingiber officinale TaxID=94328 RepID=UPI001C4CB530|nr:putative metallocarboxypeptidase ECM14 [Zingiber officinale]